MSKIEPEPELPFKVEKRGPHTFVSIPEVSAVAEAGRVINAYFNDHNLLIEIIEPNSDGILIRLGVRALVDKDVFAQAILFLYEDYDQQ